MLRRVAIVCFDQSQPLDVVGPHEGLRVASPRSIEDVAQAAGFGTPESLRRAFARRVELSPREYRARFGAR